MFSFKNPPDISIWNIKKVENISFCFKNCCELISLPDISKWDTHKVIKMKCLFYECSNLKQLPNISKWNLNNVKDMSGIFYDCYSLTRLPDISNWKLDKDVKIEFAFYGCYSLKSLPNIENWNINDIWYKKGIIEGCDSLNNLPDIYKLNSYADNKSFLLNKSEPDLSFSIIKEKNNLINDFISSSFPFSLSDFGNIRTYISSFSSSIKITIENVNKEYFSPDFYNIPNDDNYYENFYN